MSYIGDTRFKKFKKLVLYSRGIIHKWGWKYFFYVVNIELKKQGLSIFQRDDSPQLLSEEHSFQERYVEFISQMEKSLFSEQNSLKTLDFQPLITVVLFFDSNFMLLQNTLDSITQQKYQNWNVLLIPKTNKVDNEKISKLINDDRFSIFDSRKNSQDILDKISSLQGNFTAFLDVGTILYEYSLLQFVKKINNLEDSEILFSDHDYLDEKGIRHNPFFKPDWSPYTFHSMNYLSPFFIIKNSVLDKISSNSSIDDCTNFDILLNCIEYAQNIVHITNPLCSIKTNLNSLPECSKNTLSEHLTRTQINAEIENGILKNTFRIKYLLKSKPKVSIIISTKHNHRLVRRCIESIEKITNYKNFEIIIVDNADDIDLKKKKPIPEKYHNPPYKIITFFENFNFSKMNNLAAKSATGDLLLFLNDDTKVIEKFWLDELVSIAIQNDVGAVGPKLIFSDNTIQHAGISFLRTGSGFHPFMKQDQNATGYHNLENIMKECSAVTGACLLIKKSVFDKVNGFDNQFDIYYGDSDLCLKIKDAGYRIIYTPFTKLLHEGSFTIRDSNATYFAVEAHQEFISKWPQLKDGDPFYNPNLDWDYSLPEQ